MDDNEIICAPEGENRCTHKQQISFDEPIETLYKYQIAATFKNSIHSGKNFLCNKLTNTYPSLRIRNTVVSKNEMELSFFVG